MSEIKQYEKYLQEQEKSKTTVRKYVGETAKMINWLGDREITKGALLGYKKYLAMNCSSRRVNSAISAINNFLEFKNLQRLKIKTMKIQKNVYRQSDRELGRGEYFKLLEAAEKVGNRRLALIMQTICATGIRVSELQYITAEAVQSRSTEINMKGKVRTLLLPKSLCKLLTEYIKQNGIKSGCVFITKGGRPVNRSNIWAEMKKLCSIAGVEPKKVFPHNLRHLFARTFIKKEKDLIKLSAILGHSSIETTMIYTMESSEKHRKLIENLGLVKRYRI